MPQRTVAGSIFHVVNTCMGAFGVSVSKIPERLTLERHTKDLLRSFNIDCVVDVGAHHGEFGNTIRKLGYEGRIISFEPSQDSFRVLDAARAKDSAWEVHRTAMGSAVETSELIINDQSVCNSLHAPSEFGTTHKHFRHFLRPTRTENVEVDRLDRVLPELIPNLSSANIFLKIDTQGHDLEVFAGAKGIFPQVKALQVELATTPIYQGVLSMEEALLVYREGGFLPTGFFPVSMDEDGWTVIEWDCVLAKPNAARNAV